MEVYLEACIGVRVSMVTIIGASLSEPHIVVLSGCPSGGCLFAVRLTYDRISKWKIEILRPARVLHDSSELSLLRFTPVLQTT